MEKRNPTNRRRSKAIYLKKINNELQNNYCIRIAWLDHWYFTWALFYLFNSMTKNNRLAVYGLDNFQKVMMTQWGKSRKNHDLTKTVDPLKDWAKKVFI